MHTYTGTILCAFANILLSVPSRISKIGHAPERPQGMISHNRGNRISVKLPRRWLRMLTLSRAQQILESSSIVQVKYRGKDVHIDEIYETTGYAKVHYEDGTVTNAALKDLQEPQ